MNLRKDHSHTFTCLDLKLVDEVLGGASQLFHLESRGQQSGVALCCLNLVAVVMCIICSGVLCIAVLILLQLSAMDVSAQTTMKGAAKCDNLCELQNSVNQ